MWLALLAAVSFVLLGASECGTEVASKHVTTNEELASAINDAKPLRGEWLDGTEKQPMVADFNGDGYRTDTVRVWAVYGGSLEAYKEAGIVIVVLDVTEELGGGNVRWTGGYVTTIKRDEDTGPFDGRIPIIEIEDKTGDGRDDLILRWIDQFGTSIDTEIYSWHSKGMDCIEGCD